MVRAFLKGGVWKNSEDEILKAAVQKYGKQQWARVASLLNRKTAKQAKARWYEWLDPSVRKVEWSREEEEKLLHLAKLMPAQWKTIGPLVGRTSTQCQEHYEKLLDQAASASGDAEGDDANASLRSQALRPGQIDSHPETKPARPDPIDMDEDEIEMLQEARARLANTQGKKAKRKAREKMLAEAKRLADLQKRRELKQAGLLSSAAKKTAKKRRREIDLGVEIPFHKPAPAGFHDVSNETERGERLHQKQMSSIDFKKLNEQNYRSRDREAKQAKKREEARLRTLEKSNMQYVVAEVSKKNDPLNIRKRGPLNLPAPSVSDRELSQMAKIESSARAGMPDIESAAASGSAATKALLNDYSDRPLPTPMRTPLAGGAASASSSSSHASRHESLMREASNLRMLERGQTPLLGGDNPELAKGDDEDDDDGDRSMGLANATPGAPDRLGANQTPMSRRDKFGLNRPASELRSGGDDVSVGGSTFATSTMSIRELAREERRAAKRARKELESALAALPEPQFEYELAAPADMDVDDDEGAKVETVEEDTADVEAAELEKLRKEAEDRYEARSSVMKRDDLPRPVGAIADELESFADDDIEKTVDEERWNLLRHDAFNFPVSPLEQDGGKKKKKKRKSKDAADASAVVPMQAPITLDDIPKGALADARSLIALELEAVMTEKIAAVMQAGKAQTETNAMRILVEHTIGSISQQQDGAAATAAFDGTSWKEEPTKEDRIAGMTKELQVLKQATTALKQQNEKVQSKLGVLNGGFVKRAESLALESKQVHDDRLNAVIEESVYNQLYENERMGGMQRLQELRQEVNDLQDDAHELHAIYEKKSSGGPQSPVTMELEA